MQIRHNVPLAHYTSLRVGGKAECLIVLGAGDNFQDVVATANKPVWILGSGTNVLISDKGLPGTVILNKNGSIQFLEDEKIRADSGAMWDDLVQAAIAHNLWGLEFSSGIPGDVGAAIVGNIAAYGHKLADSFVCATMLNTKDSSITTWDKEAFDFSYRASNLQKPENQHFIILDATFQLSPTSTSELEYESALKTAAELHIQPDTLEHRRTIILETRRKAGSLLVNLQTGPWTAGSFFKNPFANEAQVRAIIAHEESSISSEQLLRQNIIHGGDKTRVSAAHVLLAAGFSRGQTWGNVRLHPDHILKIENIGNASAKEIYEVAHEIMDTVQQKLGITLEPEIRFLGDFS